MTRPSGSSLQVPPFAALLLGGYVALSFAPVGVKAALHTRGSCHALAHVVCFALLQWSVGRTASLRQCDVLRRAVALFALALMVEGLQTQGDWRLLEVQDLALNLAGILVTLLPEVVTRFLCQAAPLAAS